MSTEADFYETHINDIISMLEDFARSEEFSSLDFRVSKNDAFKYVMLYLTAGFPFDEYEFLINMAESRYVIIDKRFSPSQKLTPDNMLEIRAHLETLKPIIVEYFDQVKDAWGDILDEA